MRKGSQLFRGLAAIAALGLAGCDAGGGAQAPGGSDAQDETADEEGEGEARAQERIALSGTAWLTVSRRGYVYQTFIDPDGRYRDYRDGALAFTGAWRENSERELCFSPDDGGGRCWSFGGPQPDGSLRVADEDGREIILRRITYSPPAEAEEGNADNAS